MALRYFTEKHIGGYTVVDGATGDTISDGAPHSWYMGWAIKLDEDYNDACELTEGYDDKACSVHSYSAMYSDRHCRGYAPKWSAYTANGMTGYVEEAHADTLKELKQKIKQRTLAERERVARLYE